jgi:hypothetical protein
MLARAAMMDMDPPRIRMRRGTGLAAKPVPEQNGLAVAAEAGLGVAETRPAAAAEFDSGRLGGAAGAEQARLGRSGSRDPAPSCGERKCRALVWCRCQGEIIPEKEAYR